MASINAINILTFEMLFERKKITKFEE